MWQRLTTALLVALFCIAIPASANKTPPVRRVGIHRTESGLAISTRFRDVFSRDIRQRLTSGLPTRLVAHVALEDEKGRTHAYWAQSASIVYDLWNEDFVVTLTADRAPRTTRVPTADQAIDRVAILRRQPIAANAPPGPLRLQVLVEINPVSEEMLRNIHRWIARGDSDAQHTLGRNFFGSFVGYLVDRRIGQAEREVRFVSQWFTP
ncbi:MAG: DUF4390 domain-containing protein [Myxococcales bacterium]|jgi:hypothetical protein|nr:DUF4390 domain-containing protein [Myxococcales bacterium]